jgi:two-component system chemotaxis response regulator CheV
MEEILITGKNEIEIILFHINNKSYAINVSKVREILNYIPYTQLPLTPPSVLGMIKSREDVLPLISLREYLNEPDVNKEDCKIIITDFFNMKIGFLVDGVRKLLRIDWTQIQPPPEIGDNSIAIGVIKYEQEIIHMMDFEKIVIDINPILAFKGDDSIVKEYKNKKVCVAEDSKTTRKLLENHLKNKGFNKVLSFPDGKKTLDFFREIANKRGEDSQANIEIPDILITDIEMPLMDGYTLIKNIREIPIYKNLPIIIFSSISTPEIYFKKDIVGADAHITKYELDNLDNLIKFLLLKKSEEK